MHSVQQSGSIIGTTTTAPLFPADNFPKQYLVAEWSHRVPADQILDFSDLPIISSHNVKLPVCKEMNRFIDGSKPSSFGKERFPEIKSSFELSESCQLGSGPCHPEFPSVSKHNTERYLMGKKRKDSTECGTTNPHSPVSIGNVEVEQHKDVIINNLAEKNDKKQKIEPNACSVTDRPTVNNAKEFSQEDGVVKGDSMHVRAKRGQATNGHSLAERVRRERINERMRILQDLVPGCNKVAGKAVMLDEIINYVQSLQCQVEFLAMKLATVNPGLNFDLERILSKDVMLHSREGSSSILAISPGVSNYQAQLYGSSLQGAMQPDKICCIPNSSDMPNVSVPHVSSTAQLSSVWDEELLGITQMNRIPNSVVHSRMVP